MMTETIEASSSICPAVRCSSRWRGGSKIEPGARPARPTWNMPPRAGSKARSQFLCLIFGLRGRVWCLFMRDLQQERGRTREERPSGPMRHAPKETKARCNHVTSRRNEAVGDRTLGVVPEVAPDSISSGVATRAVPPTAPGPTECQTRWYCPKSEVVLLI
jgi:hypothetical protein